MKIREKILVIEDEQTIRNFMQAVLTANDYDVLLARTGAMGESMIASHCPDVIILDLGLPDVDGMEILRVNMANLRRKIEQNPAQPVYIFTEVGIGYRMIEGD